MSKVCDTVKMNTENIDMDKKNNSSNFEPSSSYIFQREDSVRKLKDSTKQLLCLLKEIQVKTSSISKLPNDVSHLDELMKQSPSSGDKDNADDCSIYKRLSRKCHCMNREEYNDFMIHFNEGTKYITSTMGEIIKNIRILKKFLYMGGDYTKRALIFLNEGYSYSTHTEKVEITQGCAHADICNVFDDCSIVIVCISEPFRDENYGDSTTQANAALFLNKLAQLEEGRRYLKFSSKIINVIKKVIRTRSSLLENDTLESLNATLNLLSSPVTQNTTVKYYCKPVDEGFGNKTVTALLQYRQNMTLEEVFTHLDLLYNLTTNNSGKNEMAMILPALLVLFEHMLIEYDDNEMNINIRNILSNVVSRGMVKTPDFPKTIIVADTGTEPILMRDEMNQCPFKRSIGKEIKSKIRVGLSSLPTTLRQPFQEKDFDKINQYHSKKSTRNKNKSKIMLDVSLSPIIS